MIKDYQNKEVLAEMKRQVNAAAKISDWSPIEKASYVGYVTTTVMEKGLDAEIKSFEEHRKSMKPQIGN